MSRQLVCPDCKQVFNNWEELNKHARRYIFGHPKAKRNIRRHNTDIKKKARRQHPTIAQANRGRQRHPIEGWANNIPRNQRARRR